MNLKEAIGVLIEHNAGYAEKYKLEGNVDLRMYALGRKEAMEFILEIMDYLEGQANEFKEF